MGRNMFRKYILMMKFTIKSRKSRILFTSLIFALLIGLSGWKSNSAERSITPDCGSSQSCRAVGCNGGNKMCAIMPCDWCIEAPLPISGCIPGIQFCSTWGWLL